MSDLVNQYFQSRYPKDLNRETDFEFCPMLGGMWRYVKKSAVCIFPRMKCVDGFEMSVQGHYGTYSEPRDDFAENYTAVEVGFPSEREELLMPYIDGGGDSDPTKSVYGWVPVSVIEAVVQKHGGLCWQLNKTDSASFINAIRNPPEPNEALKNAASKLRGDFDTEQKKQNPMTINRQINCPDPHDPDGSARLNVCLHGDKISLSSDGQCSFHFFMTFASARALAAAIVEAVPAPEAVS